MPVFYYLPAICIRQALAEIGVSVWICIQVVVVYSVLQPNKLYIKSFIYMLCLANLSTDVGNEENTDDTNMLAITCFQHVRATTCVIFDNFYAIFCHQSDSVTSTVAVQQPVHL